jgi:hypothetical protein
VRHERAERRVVGGARDHPAVDKVVQVNRTAEQALAQTHCLHKRMARVETILDMAMRGPSRLPH